MTAACPVPQPKGAFQGCSGNAEMSLLRTPLRVEGLAGDAGADPFLPLAVLGLPARLPPRAGWLRTTSPTGGAQLLSQNCPSL